MVWFDSHISHTWNVIGIALSTNPHTPTRSLLMQRSRYGVWACWEDSRSSHEMANYYFIRFTPKTIHHSALDNGNVDWHVTQFWRFFPVTLLNTKHEHPRHVHAVPKCGPPAAMIEQRHRGKTMRRYTTQCHIVYLFITRLSCMILIWHKLTASDFFCSGGSVPVPVSRHTTITCLHFVFLPFIEFITIVFYVYFRAKEHRGAGNDDARALCRLRAPQQSKKNFSHYTKHHFTFLSTEKLVCFLFAQCDCNWGRCAINNALPFWFDWMETIVPIFICVHTFSFPAEFRYGRSLTAGTAAKQTCDWTLLWRMERSNLMFIFRRRCVAVYRMQPLSLSTCVLYSLVWINSWRRMREWWKGILFLICCDLCAQVSVC